MVEVELYTKRFTVKGKDGLRLITTLWLSARRSFLFVSGDVRTLTLSLLRLYSYGPPRLTFQPPEITIKHNMDD